MVSEKMSQSKSPLKIDEVAAHFTNLLKEEGTNLKNPTLKATWDAFVSFCKEPVLCDDERLFFEADLSAAQPDSFYVHFSRTCYGRQPKGYVWSHEVICDFLFPLDEILEEFNFTAEAEELTSDSEERELFFAEVVDQDALWEVLLEREPVQASIYIGES
jgi:hypothetical protein